MSEHASAYSHGEMDIRQNEASFHVFILLAKWGSLAVAVLLVQMVLWFCTGAGFVGGFVPAVIVLALGILLLREKPGAAADH